MEECVKSHMQKSNYHQNLRSQQVFMQVLTWLFCLQWWQRKLNRNQDVHGSESRFKQEGKRCPADQWAGNQTSTSVVVVTIGWSY